MHCSDSDEEEHDDHALKYLHQWHVLENQWSDIGYHYIISKRRGLELGRPIARPGAHSRGRNNYSVGIVLCGRYDFDEYQFAVLEQLIINLICIFDINPDNILGHCEVDSNKTCPNFDMQGIRGYFHDRYNTR